MTELQLRDLLDQAATLAPTTLDRPGLRGVRRRRWRVPAVAAVAAVTAAAVAFGPGLVHDRRPRVGLVTGVGTARHTYVAAETAALPTLPSRLGVYDLDTGTRLRDIDPSPFGPQLQPVQNGGFATGEPGPGRCQSTYTVTDAAGHRTSTGVVGFADAFNVAVSPTGRYTALSGKVCGAAGSLVGIFPSGHPEQLLATSRWPTFTFSLSFSADEQTLLFATGNGPGTGALHMLPLTGAASDLVSPKPGCYYVEGRFAADSSVLASELCADHSALVRITDNRPLELFTVDGQATITATPDGKAALIHRLARGGDLLSVWHAETQRVTPLPGRYRTAFLSWD